jgi:hypothetical protein
MSRSWDTNWNTAGCSRRVRNRFLWWITASTLRSDPIVENLAIVEIKSVEVVAPVYNKQLLTHLRLANKRLGLLIDFNVAPIKDGITRTANGLPE